MRHATAFTEIPMSTRMMTDHMPKTYVTVLDRVLKLQQVRIRFMI